MAAQRTKAEIYEQNRARRQRVLDHLNTAGPAGLAQLATATGIRQERLSMILNTMKRRGEVVPSKTGKGHHAQWAALVEKTFVIDMSPKPEPRDEDRQQAETDAQRMARTPGLRILRLGKRPNTSSGGQCANVAYGSTIQCGFIERTIAL